MFGTTPIKENPIVKNESPSASEISRHDKIDMNEYLGTSNISIPLINLELSDITIPLTLSYDASGIKVNQDATEVGLGWNLSLPGTITQIIRGDDDMEPLRPDVYKLLPSYFSSNYVDLLQDLPEYGYSDLTKIPESFETEAIQEKYGYRMIYRDNFPIRGKFVQNDAIRYSTRYWDSEPDVFIINILGMRLHCVTLDFPSNFSQGYKSGVVTVLNKIGYKVSRIATGLEKDKWIVTDPNGTRFTFDVKKIVKVDNSIVLSMVGGSGFMDTTEEKASKTWYLTNIETTQGNKISLSYEESDDAVFITKGDGAVEYINYFKQTNYDPKDPPRYMTDFFLNKGPITHNKTTSKSAEKQYILTKISSNATSIKLNYSKREDIPEYKKLDNIQYKFYEEEPVKKILFSYEYKKNESSITKRLFLNSLKINEELYSFKYNSTSLPERNSFAQDYWGYFNGSTQNTSLIPNPKRFGLTILDIYYPNEKFLNNMSANLNCTKAGILEKIIYPTSGSVDFEYELNTFKNLWVPKYTDKISTSINKGNGSEGFGLRIKSITHKNSDSQILLKKSYNYYNGKSVVAHDFAKQGQITWITSTSPKASSYHIFYAMSTSGLSNVNPFSTHTGVSYDSVSCVYENLKDKINYKTTTIFQNIPHNSSADKPATGNIMYTVNLPSFEYSQYPKNGSVKEKRYYNNSDKLLKKESFTYENIKSKLF